MPYKQKLGTEEKVRAVREYLKGKVGFNESIKKSGCVKATFQEWVRQYQAEGPEAFLPRDKNRVYSSEVKRQAAQDYLSGLGGFMEISRKYGRRVDSSRIG